MSPPLKLSTYWQLFGSTGWSDDLVQKFVHKKDINKNEMYVCASSVISLAFQISFVINYKICN